MADETRSTSVDVGKVQDDGNYEFSDMVAARHANITFLVTWCSLRIFNGFEGYRLFQLDEAHQRLVRVNRRSDAGTAVWRWFKTTKHFLPGRETLAPDGGCVAGEGDCAFEP